jgi:hypothetical protein
MKVGVRLRFPYFAPSDLKVRDRRRHAFNLNVAALAKQIVAATFMLNRFDLPASGFHSLPNEIDRCALNLGTLYRVNHKARAAR